MTIRLTNEETGESVVLTERGDIDVLLNGARSAINTQNDSRYWVSNSTLRAAIKAKWRGVLAVVYPAEAAKRAKRKELGVCPNCGTVESYTTCNDTEHWDYVKEFLR